MHGEKTRDLPGLLVEPAKATITKIQVTKEPTSHISGRDLEEEDNKVSQVSRKSKATSKPLGFSCLHH